MRPLAGLVRAPLPLPHAANAANARPQKTTTASRIPIGLGRMTTPRARANRALSRMIGMRIGDFTVMALSGHQSIRTLERDTHPTNARKIEALDTFAATVAGQNGQNRNRGREKTGGRREARTRDLRVA